MPRPTLRASRPALRPAFTKTELIIIIVVVSVLVGGCLIGSVAVGILLPALGKARQSARQLKDSTQVRGITQGLVVWASNNKSTYPVPSELDLKDATIAAGKTSFTKDTTGNILSMMIFNGMISPEICINPAESNTLQISLMATYEYSNPRAAAKPGDALWDPNFRGTPEDVVGADGKPVAGISNQSYAHIIPFGKRRAQWGDTYNSTEAVFGNRGPAYAQNDVGTSSNRWALLPGPLGTSSNTLLIHGGRTTWEGNIAYNDNHVNFETSPTPMGVTFPITGPKKAGGPPPQMGPDNLFINESDEFEGDGSTGTIDKGTNAYLRPIAQVKDPAKPRTWRD